MAGSGEQLELLGTSGCHLCEQAEEILQALQAAGCTFSYEVVDIADDDVLFERYGLLIPVLRSGSEELHWPFEEAGLLALVGPPV
ncbi:glutaredoxin family protein [Parahaliea maris]|uniref:Glutaredoxin family protein n=1 Tax=Parahaliea maris TaxID=2716870 RepID=A0A5C8ZZC1_9GAMM|nr:glutaredoxin family protein [Parahaliea maris]TXS92972.1 glutaredoxin family protein [Parahaliea maris]